MDNRIMRREIDYLLHDDGSLTRLLAQLQMLYELILFGGVVRDILWNTNTAIRDIDIVLRTKAMGMKDQDVDLEQIVKSHNIQYTRNQFGGYKLRTDKNKVDIWLLENTWAFQKKIIPASVDNLLISVYLNIDAYAWNYTYGKFVANCDKKVSETIDIVLERSDCEYLNLIRAAVFSRKYKIPLSNRLITKLRALLTEWEKNNDKINNVQFRHYGEVVIKKEEVKSLIYGRKGLNEKYML